MLTLQGQALGLILNRAHGGIIYPMYSGMGEEALRADDAYEFFFLFSQMIDKSRIYVSSLKTRTVCKQPDL